MQEGGKELSLGLKAQNWEHLEHLWLREVSTAKYKLIDLNLL
jgi:hypothetical protein